MEPDHKTVRKDHAAVYIQTFLQESCDSTPVANVAEDEIEGCKVCVSYTVLLKTYTDRILLFFLGRSYHLCL